MKNVCLNIKWDKRERLNAILYLFGICGSSFGTKLYSFATSLLILKMTENALSFAISLIISSLPDLLFGIVAGVMVDKYRKQVIAIISDLSAALLCIVLLFCISIYSTNIYLLYLFNFLISACGVFDNTALLGAMINIVRKDKLTKINSLNSMIGSVISILAPLIGGYLFSLDSFRIFLAVNMFSYVLSAISQIFIDFSYNKPCIDYNASSDVAKTSDLKNTLLYLHTNKAVGTLILFSAALNFFVYFGFNVPMPIAFTKYLNFNSVQYGVISASLTIGVLFSTAFQFVHKENKDNLIRIYNSTFSLSIILFIFSIIATNLYSNSFNFFFGGLVCISFTFSLMKINIPLRVTFQSSLPEDVRGKVIGLVNTILTTMILMGQIISGLVLETQIPLYYLPLISSISLLICCVFIKQNGREKL